jgi:NAD(P)H dehydrogenase (quinone)
MVKALVAYYSRSGHTKKMAEVIAGVLREGGLNVDLKEIAALNAAELAHYEVLVFGSPTYYGSMAYQVKKLLDESVVLHGKLDGKIGAAFATAANIAGGNETTVLDIVHAFLIHGMIIQGDPQGDHYGPVAINVPDERSLKEAQRFGMRIAALAKKLFDT